MTHFFSSTLCFSWLLLYYFCNSLCCHRHNLSLYFVISRCWRKKHCNFYLLYLVIIIIMFSLAFIKESAKLRALRAKNVLACQRALHAYVLTRSRANVPCVLTYSRANVPCVFTCSRANVPCVLTCQCVLRVTCSYVNVPASYNSYIIQICYLYSGLKRGNIGETLVSLLEIFTSSSIASGIFGGLKMFEEKNLGKCTIYIGIAVMPRLCCPVFHFHQF